MNKKALSSVVTLNIISSIFFIWGISAIIYTISKAETGLAPILWLSYICLILLSIGVLRKDASLIASQLCIISIPYITWTLDFFYYIFNGYSLFGIVDYFFEPGPLIGKIISSQHLFNLPLSLIALDIIRLKRKDFWIISSVQVFLVFVITRLVTSYENNVNCVYHQCGRVSFGLPYALEWFLAYALMISLTSFILIKLFRKRKNKIKNKII